MTNLEKLSLSYYGQYLYPTKECESYFFDLDPTIEPILIFEPTFNFFESVMVPEPITLDPKSSNSSYHIPLLEIGIDHNDSVIIFQDWSCKENNFHDRFLYDPIHIGHCKYCLLYTSPSPRDS